MTALWVLAWALAVDAGVATADGPTLGAQVDRSEARIGDPLRLTITAISAPTTPVNLPTTLELAPFAVLSRDEEEASLGDGRVRRRFVLQLAAYETGDLKIPPIEVTYLGRRGEVLSARTEPVSVKITSLLANEPDPQLKENAAPVTVMQRTLLPVYIAGGLLAAGLGALLALYVRKRMKARAEAMRPPPPPRPPHEIALEKLDLLGASGLSTDEDQRPFYFAVSEILREYLGARYGFDSLELTTEELVEQLRRRAGRELVLGEIAGWLSACDLVKFAKISPTVTEARGALETAIRIVASTRPRPEPQTAEPTREGTHA